MILLLFAAALPLTANAGGSTGTTGGTPSFDISKIGTGLPNNIGEQLVNNFAAGKLTPEQFTNALVESGNISLPTAEALTKNIVGNMGADLGSLGQVINSAMRGQLNSSLSTALTALPNLGKITDIGQLADIAKIPGISQGLQAALQSGGVQEFTKQLGAALGGASATKLMTDIMKDTKLAEGLTKALGGALGGNITQALGGLKGLTDAIMKGLNINLSFNLNGLSLNLLTGKISTQHNIQNANAMCEKTCPSCCNCHRPIVEDQKNIRALMTNEFETYRTWLVSKWYIENMVPALMVMTSQMTAAAYNQVEMFGQFFDAKHQMETQRLFQHMTAKAHKDYHPSEGLCEFGTASQSLAASERRADLSKVAFAQHMLKRSLKSGDVVSQTGGDSDKLSRLQQFLDEYCDKNDNGEGPEGKAGLEILCKKSIPAARKNRDIDFTNTLDVPLSLDVDFTKPENTNDEKDIFAMSSNLYAHDVPEKMNRSLLANDKGDVRPDAYPFYMDLRALTAKRSVGQNSVAAIAAMKSRGAKEVAPFMKAFIRDLGLDIKEINKLIGEEPSYFAQMEVLTKKIYEDPVFYTELYDKPANVERKIAVMEALEIMQDRDIYDSLLRGEAILAVFLETLLEKEQEAVSNEIAIITKTGAPIKTGGSP